MQRRFLRHPSSPNTPRPAAKSGRAAGTGNCCGAFLAARSANGGATSLYLAKREGKDLLYAGKAGTGFTNTMILELARLLKPITLAKSPLSKMPDRKNKIDKWAAPKYWAEVEYRDITTDGLLRHVTFRASTPTGQRRRRSLASSRHRRVGLSNATSQSSVPSVLHTAFWTADDELTDARLIANRHYPPVLPITMTKVVLDFLHDRLSVARCFPGAI